MRITGIFTIRNAITASYPFLECIICILPLIDELLLNDGGSDDGTEEALEKLVEEVPSAKLYHLKDRKSKFWETIDWQLEELISEAEGDWIVEIQGDEFFHPDDIEDLRKAISKANMMGFNALRQPRINIWRWSHVNSEQESYQMIRIFRNLPNVRSKEGGDSFYFAGNSNPRRGYTSHNLPPELECEIPLFHLPTPFPESDYKQAKRHHKWLATESETRKKVFSRKSPRVNKWEIEEIHPKVPEIFHRLVGKRRYEVREELFTKWLKGKDQSG